MHVWDLNVAALFYSRNRNKNKKKKKKKKKRKKVKNPGDIIVWNINFYDRYRDDRYFYI